MGTRTGGGGRRSSWIVAALAVALLAAGAWAQSNEDCLTCHADRDLEGERNGRTISVYVDPGVFAGSVHGELECIACHADLEGTDFPHTAKPAPVDCRVCHEDVADELASGPHGKWATPKDRPAASCIRCHGHHDVLAPRDPRSPVNPANAERLCGECHERELREVERSVHGSRGAKVPRASCVECHRGHDVTKPRTERAELETCVACHPREVSEQRRSVHARAALKGDPLAPSCVTCHGSHTIAAHDDPSSPTATTNVPLLCGRCHHEGSRVELERDIPEKRILENYSMSIHGEGLFKKGSPSPRSAPPVTTRT